MDNHTNGNGHVNSHVNRRTFGYLARRQRAACVALAREHGVTLHDVRTDLILAAWATSVFIEANRQGIPLNPDVSLDLPRRIVAVNGTNH